MQRAIIYDDGGIGNVSLWPLTDFRACFDVRTGARTTLQRLAFGLDLKIAGLAVPMELVDLTREAHGEAHGPVFYHTGLPSFTPGDLLLNGRCVLPIERINDLELGQTLIEAGSGGVIATRPATAEAARAFMGTWKPIGSVATHDRHALMSRPWHVRAFLDEALGTDLVNLASGASAPDLRGVSIVGEAPIHIADSAKVYPGVVLDAENGPIVIDEHATVRPGGVIIGPAYIGPQSSVLDRALVKANSAIGPQCKVAGEVGGVIFQSHANKAHDGHLGDAFVGQWANLGAGTVNSNLLNTYGDVAMRATPTSPMERTGRQFMGCIIGDHVKTAIGTRIMTGAVLGTGVMYAAAAAASGTIPSFAWVTDDFPAGSKSFRAEKFLEIARAVMARRKMSMSDAAALRVSRLMPAKS